MKAGIQRALALAAVGVLALHAIVDAFLAPEQLAAYVPSRNGAAIVSFPTRRGMQAHARMLARHGYGVLLVDMRGYRAARQPKEYRRILESGHAGGLAARPAEYERRVVGFFDRTLLRAAPAVHAL